MNRQLFQNLAHLRIKEARALLIAGLPAGAYYLAGYSVECALKACIAKGVQQYDFPEKDKVTQSYSHNLTQLVKTAGLEPPLTTEIAANSSFAANWAVAKDWNETTRYNSSIVTREANDIIEAIDSPTDGVLAWLTKHW